jgi:RNA polymerase sigma factor (sigma-70 family)
MVEPDGKRAFVAALAREHGQGLRRYLAGRLREAVDDIPDLVQEVYLRLLRVPNHNTIRSPQAYLFTVAHHVLHQHKMGLAAKPELVDLVDVLAELENQEVEDPGTQLDVRRRLERLDALLEEVPPRCRVTFILHRRYGYTLEEIAVQLGVSRPMVKKYLVKALAHCKQSLDGTE